MSPPDDQTRRGPAPETPDPTEKQQLSSPPQCDGDQRSRPLPENVAADRYTIEILAVLEKIVAAHRASKTGGAA